MGCGRVTRGRWALYDDGGPGNTWDGGRDTMMKVGRATRGVWEGDTWKVGVVRWWWAGEHVGWWA